MGILENVVSIIGLVLLVVGYRKHNRNLMLAAAICLTLGSSLSGILEGFKDGFSAGAGKN